MKRVLCVASAVWLGALPLLRLFAEEVPSKGDLPAATRLAQTIPPVLRAAAERDHIELSGLGRIGDVPEVGDAAVVLITASKGKTHQQWLAELRRAEVTPKEQKESGGKTTIKYLSWGSTVTFRSEQEAIELWIAGPIEINPSTQADADFRAPVKRTRILVPGDYLRLGLDNSARAQLYIAQRGQELRKTDPHFSEGHIYSLDKPIAPEKIELAKPVAAKIGFTPEIERSWMGGAVALQAFYGIAERVPELHDIALIAMDKPSLLELTKLATGTHFMTAFGGGKSEMIEPRERGLLPVHSESFAAPFQFSLGHEPIVYGAMVVTAPKPPLDVTAGILALHAIHPKDATRTVDVTVIATRRSR